MNPGGEIPIEMSDFLKRHIRSIAHLELFLFMAKEPEKSWNAKTVSQQMRSNTSYASAQLQDLYREGLLAISEDGQSFFYNSASQNEDFIFKLNNIYNTKKTTVINLIYNQPLDTIQSFAEAFKIKKDKD